MLKDIYAKQTCKNIQMYSALIFKMNAFNNNISVLSYRDGALAIGRMIRYATAIWQITFTKPISSDYFG